MKVELGDTFPVVIQNEGTIMDYVDNEFVLVIKDDHWTPYEVQAIKSHKLMISFVYKYDITLFLVTVEDAIDTSDFIFNIHDNNHDTILQEFPKGMGYACSLYVVDKGNKVMGKRKVQLSSQMSTTISKTLKKQKEQTYEENEFICNLEGLQTAFEPFEMQSFALENDSFT